MISKILQVLRMASPLAVAVALLFHGGDDASAAQAVVSGEFVGAIPDSDPSDPPGGAADELVAVVVNDPDLTGTRAIRAYICDSDSSRAGDSEWFTGIITGDTFNLTSRSGRAFIQGQLTEDAATGTVTLADGRVLTFSAEPAHQGPTHVANGLPGALVIVRAGGIVQEELDFALLGIYLNGNHWADREAVGAFRSI